MSDISDSRAGRWTGPLRKGQTIEVSVRPCGGGEPQLRQVTIDWAQAPGPGGLWLYIAQSRDSTNCSDPSWCTHTLALYVDDAGAIARVE